MLDPTADIRMTHPCAAIQMAGKSMKSFLLSLALVLRRSHFIEHSLVAV